jgi:nucleoside-diphosphate-sugar epimerase
MAQRIWAGEAIDLAMGNVNLIWQGDANAMSLCAFDHVATPPFVFNLAGPEIISVRRACEEMARLMGKEPKFTGAEAGSALIANSQLCQRTFGYPRVPAAQVLRWTADWVMRGGANLGKPTHFEARDGKY